MTGAQNPTIQEAIQRVVAHVDGPISVDELVSRVLSVRPAATRTARASIRQRLNWDAIGKTLVFLDARMVIPLHLALAGARFRIPVTREHAETGALVVRPAFDYFLRGDLRLEDVRLLDAGGLPLPARPFTLQTRIEVLPGPYLRSQDAFDLGDWFRTNVIQRDDSVLVTVEDWYGGRFRLEHEPAGKRRQDEIERNNAELADLIWSVLEAAAHESIRTDEAIPTALARFPGARGYPGDHWTLVLSRDPRMRWDGYDIRYAEYGSLIDQWLGQDEVLVEEPFSRAQGEQVYRFRAVPAYRRSLSRWVEIQGRQTLAELDRILRTAFRHDPGDHMAGFWKRVRRGTGSRVREVDLGEVSASGEGSGAHRHVAGLRLEPGDELKYVYDFGDWIEHLLTLEHLVEPEEGHRYPRLTGPPRC